MQGILSSSYNWLPTPLYSTVEIFLASVPILTANTPQIPTVEDATELFQETQLVSSNPTPPQIFTSSTCPPASKTSFNLLTFLVKNCQCLPTTYRIKSIIFSLCGLAPSLISSPGLPKIFSSLSLVTISFFKIYHLYLRAFAYVIPSL